LTLEPGYYEVHRVGAWVSCERGNYAESRERYEAATELEPASAPLRYWFGGFLLRHSNDIEAAVSQFVEGATIDPASPQIALEIARCHLYAKKFDDADAWLKQVGKCGELPGWAARKAADLRLQVMGRRADYLQSHQDSAGALQELERLKHCYEATGPSVIDQKTQANVAKFVPVAAACERFLFDPAAKSRARVVLHWLAQFGDHPRVIQRIISEPRLHEGRITTVLLDRGFAYLHSSEGERLFFHRNDWLGTGEWWEVKEGMEVTFDLGTNSQGRCAVTVMPKQDAAGTA
jgi:tetratricopeptide (TPR) repeat protein